MYRFWLYCESFEELGEPDDDDTLEYTQATKLLLDTLPTDELLEFERVAKFLNEICEWNVIASSPALHQQICQYFSWSYI